MKELLSVILDDVIKAAVPILAAYAISYINKAKEETAAKCENEKTKKYLDEITNAIATAVAATSQTYVDALKTGNAFDQAAQTEALQRAKNTALSILSPAARNFLSETTEDVNSYLTAKIEEQVRAQKKAS